MIAVPLVVFAGVFAAEWRRTGERPARPRRARHPLVVLMALAVAGGAAVHVSVVGEHLRESPLLGAFFVLLAAAQLAAAGLLLARPTRAVVSAVVVGNVAVVGLWLWTRAVGVPVTGEGPERVGTADLLATALELGCVLLGLAVLARRRPSGQSVSTVSASSA